MARTGATAAVGGDVVFEVSTGIRDLAWLADHPHLRAESGGAGGKRGKTGAEGKDLVIRVPDGTRIEDEHGLLADLVGDGARAVIARGGRGGRGNASLATSRDRVPKGSEGGEQGEEKRLAVELRTVADVGLIGLPNAGKSTLLAALTAAHPKIADYPFTTLSPNLGVAGEDERFVVADVPGLVEGAHAGKGLGHRFLRHVSRCRALVLVVDLSTPDPAADLATVREELRAYDPSLATRPNLVVGTKLDLAPDVDAQSTLGSGAIAVSAVTGEGLRHPARTDRVVRARGDRGGGGAQRVRGAAPGPPEVRREEGGGAVPGDRSGRGDVGVRDRSRGSREARAAPAPAGQGRGRARARLRGRPARRRGRDRRRGVRVPPGRVGAMARREELLRAEAEGWEAFVALLDAVPPDRLEPPGLNAEGWAVRDVMWHVAFWCADAARALREIAEGRFDRVREPYEETRR